MRFFFLRNKTPRSSSQYGDANLPGYLSFDGGYSTIHRSFSERRQRRKVEKVESVRGIKHTAGEGERKDRSDQRLKRKLESRRAATDEEDRRQQSGWKEVLS